MVFALFQRSSWSGGRSWIVVYPRPGPPRLGTSEGPPRTMDAQRPFMLLRAGIQPAAREQFLPWFREVHLRDVSKIPGVVEVQGGHTRAGTLLGFYTFESGEAVQPALASPQ